MTRIDLSKYPRFWDDYDRKWRAVKDSLEDKTSKKQLQLIKEWYGLHIDINELGTAASVTLTEEQATMFVLRWS